MHPPTLPLPRRPNRRSSPAMPSPAAAAAKPGSPNLRSGGLGLGFGLPLGLALPLGLGLPLGLALPVSLAVPLALALAGPLLPASAQAAPAAAPTTGAPAAEGPTAGAPAAAPAAGGPTALEAPAAPSPNPWAGSLELYGFLPVRTTSSTTVKGFTADTTIWLGDLIPLIQMTASGRGSVEYGRFGLLADLSYNRIGDELSTTTPRGLLTGTATVSSSLGIYDLALRYRFGERESAVASPGSWSVIPYAGIRLVDASLNVDATIRGNGPLQLQRQRQGELSKLWAQPLLGTQATLFLSPRLRAFGRADIGGFGLAGSRDLSGNAQLGLGYAIGNSTDLNISWRYLGLAYDNGANVSSGFTNYQNGVELGLKFFF